MKQFKIGDRASLKSGGPPMTVIGADNISVSCTWFEESRLHTEIFQAEWLDHVGFSEKARFTTYEAVAR